MKRLIGVVVAGLIIGCAAVDTEVNTATISNTDRGETVMTPMLPSCNLSVSIASPHNKVYEFVSIPENIPKWAKGLGGSVRKVNNYWIVDTVQGPVKVRFAGKNHYGVLDHYVTTPTGLEVYVPLRVIPNGPGSEVIFTLFRLPEMSDERYAEDQKMVEQDLETLKDILEKKL